MDETRACCIAEVVDVSGVGLATSSRGDVAASIRAADLDRVYFCIASHICGRSEPFGRLTSTALRHLARRSQHVPSSTTTSTRINTLFPPMQRESPKEGRAKDILPHLAAQRLCDDEKWALSSKTKQELTSIYRLSNLSQATVIIQFQPITQEESHLMPDDQLISIFL